MRSWMVLPIARLWLPTRINGDSVKRFANPVGGGYLGRVRYFHVMGSLLLLWLLAACSRPTLPTWLGGAAPTSTPPPVVATELSFWHWPGTAEEDAHLRLLLDDFQRSHPEIVIDLQQPENYARRLRTALSNDRPPDLLYLNSYQLPDYVADGILAPLPPAAIGDNDQYPHLQRAMQLGGTTYCRPQSFYTLALFYNKTRFDDASLAYPTASWRWEDLQRAASALTDSTSGQFGLVLAADLSRWLAFLQQAGGTILNPDGRAMALNSPEGAAALDFYANLILEGMAATPSVLDSRWPGEAFAQGRAALVIEGSWLVPYLAANTPALAYGIAPLPMGPAGAATVSFATCYAITNASPHQEAAQLLLDYLTAPEQMSSWIAVDNALPARPSLQEAWRTAHPEQAALLAQVTVATEWQLPPGFQPWVADANEQISRLFGGFIPSSAVLPEAESTGNALLVPDLGTDSD